MNTIQDQLREHGELIDDAYNQPGHASPWAVELYEAADRIDALETALRGIRGDLEQAIERGDHSAWVGVAYNASGEALEASS